MKLADYARHDGTGLATLVREGEVSPTELARTALDAIEALNPRLNAVIEVYRERVEELDESTLPDGPFRGVPFLLKRIGISEAGRPMGDLGARLLAEWDARPVAAKDSYVVGRFRDAGLNIMGHTTMPEMAYTVTVESAHQGTTHNPWSPDVVAGGSSTGAGVAVASGMVPMAHASDAAGSTRFPASCNGLIGLKPSRGWISPGPAGSDLSNSKVSHFAVTRTVRDAATMLDALHGGLPGEAIMYHPPAESFAAAIARPPGKLRVALSSMRWHTRDLADDVRSEMERVGRTLEALGHSVVVDKPEIDFDAYRELYKSIYYMDSAVMLTNLRKLFGGDIDLSKLQPVIQRATSRGGDYTIADYAGTLEAINGLSRSLGAFFERYDVLLTPSLATGIPRLGETSLESDMTAEEFIEFLLGINQHLPLPNLTGTPAITLPLCTTEDGLPLGAHFIMPIGQDARLLQLSRQLEEALPWQDRRPPVHAGAL